MVGSVKLFQFLIKSQQMIGIAPNQSKQKQHLINALYSTALAQLISTSVIFLIFKAKSMFDYGFAFFVTSNTVKALLLYLLLMWQCENTLKFIEYCEGFIAKSKSCLCFSNKRFYWMVNKFLCNFIIFRGAIKDWI